MKAYRQAEQLISFFPEGEASDGSIRHLASMWSYSSKDSLALLLQEVPESPFRQTVTSGMVNTMFAKDPAQAMERVDELFSGKDREKQILSGLAYANGNYDTILPWATQLPESKELNGAVASVITRWSAYDAQAASKWITQQPAGAQRDLATTSLAKEIAQTDPMNAIAWAGSIGDEKQRTATLKSVVTEWKRFDRNAATEWIKSSDIPLEMKESFLK